MRWVMHWKISKDCYDSKSLIYQLGSILPDWFMRHPIHCYNKTKEKFEKRLYKTKQMKPGFRKNWNAGVLAHYIEDYCCTAHSDENYFHLYNHRVFEVQEQKFFKKFSTIKKFNIESKETIIETIESTLQSLQQDIKNFNSNEWYTDTKIMELDIYYSYALVKTVLQWIG